MHADTWDIHIEEETVKITLDLFIELDGIITDNWSKNKLWLAEDQLKLILMLIEDVVIEDIMVKDMHV
jgi:hypothetical protein